MIRELHHLAMEHADVAYVGQIRGDLHPLLQRVENKRAMVLEAIAAALCGFGPDWEPTRSVLYRSAACLAVSCGEYKYAIVLAESGLHGTIHTELRTELEEVIAEAKDKINGKV